MRVGRRSLLIFLFFLLAINTFTQNIAYSRDRVNVYIYHLFPPFVTGEGKGLSYDVFNFMKEKMEKAHPNLEFKILEYPKTRLNSMVDNPKEKGLVFWPNTIAFKDDSTKEKKYIWSHVILNDESIIVSNKDDQKYTSFDKLIGTEVAVVAGRHYQETVERLFLEKKVSRIDLNSELSILQFVAAKRASSALSCKFALKYYQSLMPDKLNVLDFKKNLRLPFERRIMIFGYDKNSFLTKEINELLLKENKEIQRMLETYIRSENTAND